MLLANRSKFTRLKIKKIGLGSFGRFWGVGERKTILANR